MMVTKDSRGKSRADIDANVYVIYDPDLDGYVVYDKRQGGLVTVLPSDLLDRLYNVSWSDEESA